MKQFLILITGAPSVGKTKTADDLFKNLENSAMFDGDWGWNVNPFSLDDPRLRNGDKNISYVLDTYLQSNFKYVICSSVLFLFPEIKTAILGNISHEEYEIISIHLFCDCGNLKARHYGQGLDYDPTYDWLELNKDMSDFVIDTSLKTVKEVSNEIKKVINMRDITIAST